MFKLLKKLWRDRRGNALAIAGAALPLIIGSAGLASDTIQWALMKRQLQRTADSAALAGVYGKMSSQTVNTGTCSTANSQPVYRDVYTQSDANTRLDTTVTCTVGTPSSPWNGSGYQAVQVTVSAQRAMAFSGFFVSTAPTITASATAAVVQSGKYCVISLKNTAGTGLSFSGGPTVNLGCGMKTNAKGADAVNATGNPSISASPVAAVGQIDGTAEFTAGTTFQPYSAPQSDPFASVSAPSVPSGCNEDALRGCATTVSASVTAASPAVVCYKSLKLTSGNVATFTDAVIILNGGDLDIGAQATLNCTRCTFVLTSTDGTAAGNVTINGGATVNMTPPTTGTYANLVIYKDRRTAYCNNCNKINGNSSSTITGGIYAPTQEVQFSGDGGMSSNCVQIVSWEVTFTGNSTISNSCGTTGPHPFDGSMVRLVA
jgi:Flp pilus assembly protein TadG